MELETLTLTTSEGVAHVQLTRGEQLNTMTPQFWEDMISAFEAIEKDGSVRAVVLSSTGRHFTAGLDLNSATLSQGEDQDEARRAYSFTRHLKRLQQAFNVIESCRVPVIAAVHGACIGGGVDMVCACDIRLASDNAYFTIQEINIGIVADVGTIQRIPYLLPEGIVRELTYTGRKFPAEEARSFGFVNRVTGTHEETVDAAFAMAQEIASKSPVAVMGCKTLLNRGRGMTVEQGLDYVGVWNAAFIHGDDMKEAVSAQMQKRPPKFADIS
ncbi:enoyl-CoA hydratase [Pacificimonas flava]|uniref:Enoyl-CoA hydratase n=2 Tax=Pacificimonas TaxID=1960290 RepID=A0A219B394_9SPHN|nr:MULTISPECIES: crotonase/enoyl-CoA hydratase family protein [Pacificimonas]MBZ6378071.1 crotonase/enoyl-CoA hydratase family protein [Pacificimonas aurantium]OWV32288.1 enoyl-CoA hydratase [Pacificimonas flava]